MVRLSTKLAAPSSNPYSARTGPWNTPQAAGTPVRIWMAAPAARMLHRFFFKNACIGSPPSVISGLVWPLSG